MTHQPGCRLYVPPVRHAATHEEVIPPPPDLNARIRAARGASATPTPRLVRASVQTPRTPSNNEVIPPPPSMAAAIRAARAAESKS